MFSPVPSLLCALVYFLSQDAFLGLATLLPHTLLETGATYSLGWPAELRSHSPAADW